MTILKNVTKTVTKVACDQNDMNLDFMVTSPPVDDPDISDASMSDDEKETSCLLGKTTPK